ncbi:Mpo1-like protein [Sneathiella sp.]|uniref:Mpo1-like protein n=1 Tax=Sneathiella sp. TaxID=1964365 RepID=UPI00356305FC
MANKIQTYAEFWPYYLREHSSPKGRHLHYLGTTLALFALILAIVLQMPSLILLALICGYGPAWIAHFYIEKNRPATFSYPFWSLLSDFRMYFTWLSGKLPRELEKAGI